MTGPAGAAGQAVTPDAQVADAGDKVPLGAWLRQQREDRGWSRREQARRLIQAGRAAGTPPCPAWTT